MRDDIRARRSKAALESIKSAIGADISAPVRARDPRDRSMFELEAIAEAVKQGNTGGGDVASAVETLKNATEDELRSVEGIGKARAQKIQEALG